MSYVQAEVMTENGASYIVRAAFCGGGGAWLSAPDEHGMRDLGDRERAAVFTSLESARAAIAKMPPILADALVEFVAEPLLDSRSAKRKLWSRTGGAAARRDVQAKQ
jgi:hypothetical protein